ncbi:Nuclear transcription factor Y subunit B-5 [Vitis vinifera]|uniref:Nuclear transcription factor Y subunit B-5 n=1 Tax=Vitis vinifera TaxID=29760 RepID=A0A438JRT8_VITVI|nr:Nuclear transcription factor Y subunit B-5 [Vitis vinifera]
MADKQDLLLPIANVGRIMKQILPPGAKVSKEAKETVQECVSEFVKFVTGEASAKCRKEDRQTVTVDDICWALSALGLDDYAGATVRGFSHISLSFLLSSSSSSLDEGEEDLYKMKDCSVLSCNFGSHILDDSQPNNVKS